MTTISIANCKGGVGKTIVAANLACELADNLYLVPGSRDTIHFDGKNGERVLANCLKDETLTEVDFVIIEHPPTLSEYTLAGDW